MTEGNWRENNGDQILEWVPQLIEQKRVRAEKDRRERAEQLGQGL